MYMLAPGFFTKDDVELWNKMPEADQKAVIQGSFGASSVWKILVDIRKGCIRPLLEINKVLKFEGNLGKFGFAYLFAYPCKQKH